MVFSVVVRILMLQQPTESCSSNKGTQMRNKRKDMVSINNYSTYIIYVYIYIYLCVCGPNLVVVILVAHFRARYTCLK